VRQRPNGRNPIVGLSLRVVLILLVSSTVASAQTPPPPPTPETPKDEAKSAPKSKDAPPATPKPASKPGSSRSRPGDDEPIVMSSEAMAKARGKLDKDRYGAEPDWSEIPVWRQTSFFGIRAEGQLFIYVVDCSGSMDDEDRLDRAKSELRRSVNALQSPQRFKVIFYNNRPVPMPGELPKPADYPSKAQLSRWLTLIEAEGATDPRSSLSLALAMKPDAVFLLSDGAFPEGTPEAVAKLNPKKVPIHCIDLANGAAGDGLRKIASESGGQYAARGR
jgi:von Willebrand factor type A domain